MLCQRDEEEPYVRVPLLDAVLAEEFIHVWDYRLEAGQSPYASAGDDWQEIECNHQFDIPNRRSYERTADDWASAVVWYLLQREELRRRSPERYEFVTRLFREGLHL